MQALCGIIAVRHLESRDILIHVESKVEKERLKYNTQWIARIRASATIKKHTYRVLVHSIRVADFSRSAGQTNVKLIKKENRQLHSELNIKSVA
jgi:ribosomal protein L20